MANILTGIEKRPGTLKGVVRVCVHPHVYRVILFHQMQSNILQKAAVNMCTVIRSVLRYNNPVTNTNACVVRVDFTT